MISSAFYISFIANVSVGPSTTSTFTISSHGFSSFVMASMCSFHTFFRSFSANTAFPFLSLMQLLPAKSVASFFIILIRWNTTFLSFVPREAGLHMVGMCPQEDQIYLNTSRPLSLQEEDLKSGLIFLWPAPNKTWTGRKRLSCFMQEMWKATRDPCGTVLYVHIKSLHIKPPSNAIIPLLIGFTSNAHTSNSNPTHPHSYVSHIKSLPQKLVPTYTI